MTILGTVLSLVTAALILGGLLRWLWPRLKPDWLVTPSEVMEAVALVWYQNNQIMRALNIEEYDEAVLEAKAILEEQGYSFD